MPFDVVKGQNDEEYGEHAGHYRDDRLHSHDQVKAHHAAAHDEGSDDDKGDDLDAGAAAPAQTGEDR